MGKRGSLLHKEPGGGKVPIILDNKKDPELPNKQSLRAVHRREHEYVAWEPTNTKVQQEEQYMKRKYNKASARVNVRE